MSRFTWPLTVLLLLASAYGQAMPPLSAQQQLEANSQYGYFQTYGWDTPYSQRRPDKNGVIDLSATMLNDYATSLAAPSHPATALRSMFAYASVVVACTAIKQQSTLTPRGSYIISDWTMEVTRVFRNQSSIPIGQTITVTRTAGSVTVGNLKLVAHDGNFADFQLQHQYVLLLVPLPNTGSFMARENASFDVTGPATIYMTDPWADYTNVLKQWTASFSGRDFTDMVTSIAANVERAQ